MKSIPVVLLVLFSFFYSSINADPVLREYYQLTIYHFTNPEQEHIIDNYLEKALLPALHSLNIKTVGVFKPLSNDTATDKVIYILVPLQNVQQIATLTFQLNQNKQFLQAGKEFADMPYNMPAYRRMECLLFRAFPLAPKMKLPKLVGPRAARIYEFRSYESASEKLYRNKVKMFNEGGEITLFERLHFNAIFYAEVITGSSMPNLVYMTSFENMSDRDAHWKTFGEDAVWKKLSSMPEYKNNVSKADILLMKAAAYSDY